MRKRTRVCVIILLCAAMAIWADAYLRVRALADAYTGLSVRMADAKVSDKKLMRLLAGEGSDAMTCAAAWTRGGKVAAEAPSMQTTAKLRVISVMGDMRQVTPMRLVSGSYLAEDDDAGCVLDTESARALFRSVEVTGVSIVVGKARYTVRGVVAGGEPMALVRGTDTAYENLELAVPDISTGKATVDAFLYRYALSDDYTVVESGLYVRILRGLLWLPVALGLLFALARLLRGALRLPLRTGRTIALSASAVLCGAAAVALLGRTFFWPQAYLPTKCADFAFWGALLGNLREAWTEMSLATPLPKDIQFFRGMRACICRLAAILLLEVGVYGCFAGPVDGNRQPEKEART